MGFAKQRHEDLEREVETTVWRKKLTVGPLRSDIEEKG